MNTQITGLLEVQNIEECTSQNYGFRYKKVTFGYTYFIGNLKVKTNVQGTRNLFDKRELEVDGKMQVFKADPLYISIKKGDVISGKIVRFNTSSYEIGERTVNSWTGIIFENEDSVKYANSQLKSNGAEVITSDGIVINSEKEAELAFAEPVL